MPHEPSSATDFVQDYAAKRAAQIERAKKIREERQQRITREQRRFSPSASRQHTEEDSNGVEGLTQKQPPVAPSVQWESAEVPPSAPGTLTGGRTSLHPPARARRIANVVEEDFKRATRAGIITPDQARQLWAMLSDQLVQVDNPHANSFSSASISTPAVSTLVEGAVPEFGGSISMDSLRASIAQFKEQQRRKQQQMMGGEPTQSVRGAGAGPHAGRGNNNNNGAFNGVNEAYDVATRMFSPAVTHDTAFGANRQVVPRGNNKESGGGVIDEPQGGEEEWVLRPSPTPAATGRRGKSQKPAWNYDVSVPHENEDNGGGGAIRQAAPPAPQGKTAAPSRTALAKGAGSGQQGGGVALQFDDIPVGGGNRNNFSDREHLTNETTGSSRPPKQGVKAGDGAPTTSKKHGRPHATGTNSGNSNNNNTAVSGYGQRQAGASAGGAASLDDVVVGGSGGGISYNDVGKSGVAPPPPANEPLLPCNLCGRTFRSSILARHEAACAKVQKKRRVFDMKGQRLEGIEGIHDVAPSSHISHGRGDGGTFGAGKQNTTAQMGGQAKLPKWKIQHEQFQAAMRAMRQVTPEDAPGGKSGAQSTGSKSTQQRQLSQPVPLPAEYDDRVPCPHCGRKFAQMTAERHIPKCATTIAKPKGLRPTRR